MKTVAEWKTVIDNKGIRINKVEWKRLIDGMRAGMKTYNP